MKKQFLILAMIGTILSGHTSVGRAEDRPLNVVATLSDYAFVAKEIGGDRVVVQSIVLGEQDAHYIRPKPSFVDMVREADVLIDTGLDLEMWLPTVVDKAGNNKVRSGQTGYIAVSKGLELLEKPQVLSRSEGGVHVYGNPHITPGPINMRTVARNIAAGLSANDPQGKDVYKKNLEKFIQKLDEKIFGAELVQMMGGDVLADLAATGKLIPFLEKQKMNGKPLTEFLGGWAKQMLPLRNTPIVTYHKSWVYFMKTFGLEEAGTVEPKPGIPPSPRHVIELTEMMKKRGIKILLAESYFDHQQIRAVAGKVNAEPVIVPLYVGGQKATDSYFSLVELWINSLLEAARKKGLIASNE